MKRDPLYWVRLRRNWRLRHLDTFWNRGVLLRVVYIDEGPGFTYERVD